MTIVAFTDGVWAAGYRTGEKIDLPNILQLMDPIGATSAQTVADAILAAALQLDQNRPHDDASVLVTKIMAAAQSDNIRRLFMRFPI